MRIRVQKWGKSVAIRIPKSYATKLALRQNGLVELSLRDGALQVAPVAEATLKLEALLANVTDENLHGEIDAGPALGGEAW